MSQAAVRIERLAVKRDRVSALVRCVSTHRYTSADLACRVIEKHPELPFHACVNDKGPRFGDVLVCTSVPHLLEHLVIDLQVRACDEQVYFTGSTEWLDEREGLARVEVSFADDIVALHAFSEALDAINDAIAGL